MSLQILSIPPTRWQEYKNLRLEADKNDPEAFGASADELMKKNDLSWKNTLLPNPLREMIFAQMDGKLIGMIGINYETMEKVKHTAKLTSFYVTPSSRGQKVGLQLLQEALSKIAEKAHIKKVVLSVTKSKVQAIKLYQKLDFETIGTYYDEIYHNGKYYDQIAMQKYVERNN
ncbi:MAG TPA: GNAT family N-acetyltransferase [Candidatus Paceibacterota bacterium]|nr:GNAT family N-acetyltransferase [Candidatus Paceibacterota bacterium]